MHTLVVPNWPRKKGIPYKGEKRKEKLHQIECYFLSIDCDNRKSKWKQNACKSNTASNSKQIPNDKIKWNILWIIIWYLRDAINFHHWIIFRACWMEVNRRQRQQRQQRRQFWNASSATMPRMHTTNQMNWSACFNDCMQFWFFFASHTASMCYACISWHWPRIFFKCNVTFTDPFTIEEMYARFAFSSYTWALA